MVGTGRFTPCGSRPVQGVPTELPTARLSLASSQTWPEHSLLGCELGCIVGQRQTEMRPPGRVCCMQCNGRDGQI